MPAVALIEGTDIVATLPRPMLMVIQCHACGYEPPKGHQPPRQCPKCYCGSWERFIWQGKLEQAAPPKRRS